MQGRFFLDRYETIRRIGQGGMGTVWLARDRDSDNPVVVKVMHEHIAADPKFLARFEREMQVMASFHHTNAVEFIDAGLQNVGGPCIVMEYLPGVTLDKLLQRAGTFSPMRLRRILAQLCVVLQAAHEQGMVHRDLKPANLMVLDPDTPFEKLKVMDFGLAQLAEPEQVAPVKGRKGECAVGTPGYMSPEQVHGENVDQRGDIYSIGAILYQMLTGRLPFPGKTTMEILMAQVDEAGPPTFASIGVGDKVPAAVEEVVRSCLAVEPEKRPQSAFELGELYEVALLRGYGKIKEPTKEEAAPAEPREPPPPDAMDEHIEAYMPEQIALYKLRGFAEEFGGKMLQSVPGLIRIRVDGNSPGLKSSGSGLFSWFGRASLIDVELHMKKKESKIANLLDITVCMRPANGTKAPNDPDWQRRCRKIHSALKAYLMSKT